MQRPNSSSAFKRRVSKIPMGKNFNSNHHPYKKSSFRNKINNIAKKDSYAKNEE